MVTSIITELESLTEEGTYSLLPDDLESSNEVVEGLLELLEDTLALENDTDQNLLVRLYSTS